MSKSRYYRMWAGWLEHQMFGGEPFCRRAAWAWLIENAAYAPHNVQVAGTEIRLERGQLIASHRRLAEIWRWERTKVRRFLKKLQERTAIAPPTAPLTATGHVVITICNYDKHQTVRKLTDRAAAPPSARRPPHENRRNSSLPNGKDAGASPEAELYRRGKEVLG